MKTLHKLKIFIFNLLFSPRIGKDFLAKDNARLSEALLQSHDQASEELNATVNEFSKFVDYVVSKLKPKDLNKDGQPTAPEIRAAIAAVAKFKPSTDHGCCKGSCSEKP